MPKLTTISRKIQLVQSINQFLLNGCDFHLRHLRVGKTCEWFILCIVTALQCTNTEIFIHSSYHIKVCSIVYISLIIIYFLSENQYRGHIFFKPLISDKVTKLKNTKNEKYTSDARLIVIKSKKKYIIKTSFHILWNQIMNIYLLSGGFGPMSRDCRKKYKYIFLVLFKLILVIYAAASAIVVLILKGVRQSLQCNRCPLSDTVRVNIRSATF